MPSIRPCLSLYDGWRMHRPEGDIYIPSLTFEQTIDHHVVPVANTSKKALTLWRGCVLGELVFHQSDASRWGVECYPLCEVLEEINNRKISSGGELSMHYGVNSAADVCDINQVPCPSKTDTKNKQSPSFVNDVNIPSHFTPAFSDNFDSSTNPYPTQPQPPTPVPFSSIVGVGKVSPGVDGKMPLGWREI